MRLRYALFPGCTGPIRELSCELSTRTVFEVLGIGLEDLPDFSCCMPACLVHSFDYATGLALTTRNFCVAEDLGLNMVTICTSCFENLSRAKYLLADDLSLANRVQGLLARAGRRYLGTIEVKHVVSALHDDYGLRSLRNQVENPLRNVKAAAFYGCHLVLPNEYVQFDDPEYPVTLDRLIDATGADSVYHMAKMSCCIGCGAFFGGVADVTSLRLARNILNHVKRARADCMVVTCPFCMMQLEMGQLKLAEKRKNPYNIPVLFYLELLGLSLGLEPKDLGMNLHRIDNESLLARLAR